MSLDETSLYLRIAEDSCCAEQYSHACDTFEQVAAVYVEAGFLLEAVSILEKVLEIADQQSLPPRIRALSLLAVASSSLGLQLPVCSLMGPAAG